MAVSDRGLRMALDDICVRVCRDDTAFQQHLEIIFGDYFLRSRLILVSRALCSTLLIAMPMVMKRLNAPRVCLSIALRQSGPLWPNIPRQSRRTDYRSSNSIIAPLLLETVINPPLKYSAPPSSAEDEPAARPISPPSAADDEAPTTVKLSPTLTKISPPVPEPDEKQVLYLHQWIGQCPM
eukprot:scaffold3202_cov22-Cyclotella_meneghiniana.AAC.1